MALGANGNYPRMGPGKAKQKKRPRQVTLTFARPGRAGGGTLVLVTGKCTIHPVAVGVLPSAADCASCFVDKARPAVTMKGHINGIEAHIQIAVGVNSSSQLPRQTLDDRIAGYIAIGIDRDVKSARIKCAGDTRDATGIAASISGDTRCGGGGCSGGCRTGGRSRRAAATATCDQCQTCCNNECAQSEFFHSE